MANVVPTFKKGNKAEVSNYRPVSLIPVISKILKRCVYSKIIQVVKPNLTKMQHSFLKGKSTVGQLLHVFSQINDILERKNTMD